MQLKTVQINGRVKTGSTIAFLSVDLLEPLGRVRYALRGVPQDSGIRIDLDKRIFLDRMADERDQPEADRVAPLLFDYLASPEAKALRAAAPSRTVGTHVVMSPPLARGAQATD